jgi:hypothetical protein
MQSNHGGFSKTAFHGYVPSNTHDKFERYWGGIGLTSASALVALLIVREIELKRLTSAGRHSGAEPRASKVSAYVPTQQAVLFKDHAAGLGRSVSDCVAELVEREVGERWLHSALRLQFEETVS